ncbi:MAG: phospholipase [Firmicutes bacterium]|nr:phospholipase [Bacillota bacterium]MCM1401054.1 phospholipase [Bacteroides sp.]MCM1476973.1 phospholipase [Bacteroides sp.]
MIVALYILLALVAVGTVLYIMHRHDMSRNGGSEAPVETVVEPEAECCGMHITCEKDSLLASVSSEIEYYDDEELDRYRGVPADGYSDDAIEEFRNVLLTLIPTDIAGWARSIQLRGIELPAPVREELLMIVAETRAARTA